MVVINNIALNVNPPTSDAASAQSDDQVGLPANHHRNAICRDSAGRLWVCYVDLDNTEIRAAYSDNLGANWTLDAIIDNGSTSIARGHQIHLDPTTQQPVIFAVDFSTNLMRFTKRLSAATWTAWADMGTTTTTIVAGQNKYYSGCIDSNGKFHVVLKREGATTVGDGVYITNVSGSFVGTSIWTDSASMDTFMGCLAADDQGFIHLFYRYRSAAGAQFQYYRYVKKTSSDSFPELNVDDNPPSAPVEIVQTTVITTGNTTVQEMIDIAIDSGGSPHLCWIQNTPVGTFGDAVYYGKKVAGVWTVELIESDTGRSHMAPTIAANQNGDIFVSWMELATTLTGDNEVVIARRVSSWSVSVPFSVGGDDDCWPSLMHHQVPLLGIRPGITKTGYLGVFCDFDSASGDFDYKLFYSDDWAAFSVQEFVTEGPPSCPAEPDRASKALAGEGTASLSYPQTPDLVFEEQERFQTRKAESDHGYETTHARFATSRRMWTAQHLSISKTQRDTIMDFIQARLGAEEAFNFTLVETGGTVKVRFLPETIRSEKKAPNVYDVTFQVEELLT